MEQQQQQQQPTPQASSPVSSRPKGAALPPVPSSASAAPAAAAKAAATTAAAKPAGGVPPLPGGNPRKRPAPVAGSGGTRREAPAGAAPGGGGATAPPSAQPQRVGKDGEPLSEKKLRRLEKNRLSARECRRRKREATENMQGQINQLESENLRLRLQLQVGEEAEQTNHQKQIDSTKVLDELLKSGKASESEIYAKIEEYKEKFADYGRDRRSAMEFHLRNVERLLMPTQTTSFIMNTLKDSSGEAVTEDTHGAPPQQVANHSPAVPGPAPVSGSGSPSPEAPPAQAAPKTSKELFTLLVRKLEVTPAQAAALKDSRFVAEEMDQTLRETLTVLKDLRKRLAQCGQDLETEFHCIRQILTPSQSAKFLVWVARNKACMHMLNELWSKNYPTSDKHVPGAAATGSISASASGDE